MGGGGPADVVGRRIGAAVVDVLVLAIVFLLAGVAFGGAEAGDGQASVRLEGAQALVYFAIVLIYYFAAEAATGQTLGKRVLGLRVVRLDGSPAGAGAIALRTILRVVDSLPFAYIVGLIVMLATPSKQRVGDLAAGTVVVAAR